MRQVNNALRATNGGEILDLLPTLIHGRRSGPVHPRTDSSRGDRGAFFAYRELMKEAAKRVIELEEPLLLEDAVFVPREGFRGDLATKAQATR